MKDGGARQGPVIDNLRKFLKHDDAAKITRRNLLEWRDHLLSTDKLSAKTISDIHLFIVRSLVSWAHQNEQLPENAAETAKPPEPRKAQSRELGHKDPEALAILKAALVYEAAPDEFGRLREKPQSVDTKRWASILCAFSGARISEITQLRKEDVREDGGRWVMRITPDAGSVKTGGYRDVPRHRQIVFRRAKLTP